MEVTGCDGYRCLGIRQTVDQHKVVTDSEERVAVNVSDRMSNMHFSL